MEVFMKTSIRCLQWGHVMRSVSDGDARISPSQALHLKWMLRIMKLLSLVLVVTIPVQAQTLADVARQERARQARIRSGHLYEGKGTRTETTTPPPAAAAPAAATPAAPAPATAVPNAKPPAPKPSSPPAPDPAVLRAAEIEKLRAKIAQLEDQERALQLQVTQFTNQLLAPVTDQNAKDEAQTQIGTTQNKLNAVRAELDLTKKTLEDLLSQGPPKS
jgi:hypothetical protein